MKIYHTETQEDYDALMVELEKEGVLWIDDDSPTKGNAWELREQNTAILLDDTGRIKLGKRFRKEPGWENVATIEYKVNSVESAIKQVSDNNAELFHKIITDLEQTYLAKNKDYGNSFEESLNEFGEVAGIVRIGDKFNRAKNLSKNKANVTDESKIDTYLDMANYNIMQVMWLMKQED